MHNNLAAQCGPQKYPTAAMMRTVKMLPRTMIKEAVKLPSLASEPPSRLLLRFLPALFDISTGLVLP
jgi:hypothetical protein